MDPDQIAMIVAASLTITLLIIGMILSIVFRKNTIMRATIPMLNLPLGVIYILMVLVASQQSIFKVTPCALYLWLPFILIIALGNVYSLKGWRLYFQTVNYKFTFVDLHDYRNDHSIIPSSVKDLHLEEVSLIPGKLPQEVDEIEFIDTNKANTSNFTFPKNLDFAGRGCCFRLDKWMFNNKTVGSMSFLIKIFLAITFMELTIPLYFTFTIREYQGLDGNCRDRTIPELVSYVFLLSMYIIAFLFFFFRLRRNEGHYILSSQLLASSLVWILILLVFCGIFGAIYASDDNDDAELTLSLFSITTWCLPFAVDILWPLWKTYKNVKIRKHDDIEKHPSKNSTEWILCSNEESWILMAKHIQESKNISDSRQNEFLLHGLFFIKEFLLTRDNVKRLRSESIANLTDLQREMELCILVIISWYKYFRREGEFTWLDQDETAKFLIEMKELETIHKSLEEALKEIIRSDQDERPSIFEQAKAGSLLREAYNVVLKNLDKSVLHNFRRSVHYEDFKTLTNKKVST